MGSAPKTTIWKLEPHTRAKHVLLEKYLQAWVPILSLGGFDEFAYIDGFAGPGKYAGGEEGSPIIALRAALRQKVQINAMIYFLFIEKDPDRAAALQREVDAIALPKNFRTRVANATFEEAFTDFYSFFEKRRARKGRGFPPTFAFIDPFGWSGVPFRIVRQIAQHKSCEVFINFMYEEINRFLSSTPQEANFDEFFDTAEWREALNLVDTRQRNRFLHDLYGQQLRDTAGLKYVRSFEMRNDKNVVDYYLFYGTKSVKGLKQMKAAMWKVDTSGEFRFSDATNQNQIVLFEPQPRFDLLERALWDRFRGKTVPVEDVEEFVLAETGFRETHYKKQVLTRLEFESPPRLTLVSPPPNRKPGTYGDPKLKLRFAP